MRLVELPARRGKAAALNAGVAVATGEVLLLTDTRQRLEPEVARMLVRNLADPSVGAVSGELVLYASEAGSTPIRDVGLYWRYEKMIRKAESQFGSSIGYTGAIAAVRRRLFPALPEDTLVDDLVVPLTIVSRGSRVVFEPAAQASDAIAADRRAEFRRKVRTLAGVLQTFLHMRRFAGPLPGLVWWQFVSHKLLRLAVPFALLACLGASAWLSAPFYRAAFATQAVVYALGVVGLVVTGPRPARPRHLAPGNAAPPERRRAGRHRQVRRRTKIGALGRPRRSPRGRGLISVRIPRTASHRLAMAQTLNLARRPERTAMSRELPDMTAGIVGACLTVGFVAATSAPRSSQSFASSAGPARG